MAARRPLAERFWEKVDKSGECWLWTASVIGKYGNIGHGRGRGTIRAHRAAWELTNGPIPDGMWVLHKCDVPLCVRPDHLFLGDRKANMADMVVKQRQRGAPGGRNGSARLTPDQVGEIRRLRASGMMLKDIAARYGVGVSNVCHITRGRNWRSV